MKTKDFRVVGMMCDHCRARVEKALNSVYGDKAVVTREPDMVHITYEGEAPLLTEVNKVVQERAGEIYTIQEVAE